MKKMNKLLALLLALVMMLALVACGGDGEADPTKAPDKQEEKNPATQAPSSDGEKDEGNGPTVRIGVAALPDSFAPWVALSTGRKQVLPTVYQPLLDLHKPTGKAVCVLVKEYEQIEDFVWRCTLWDDIYDTAGNHFTASDAVFNIAECKKEGGIVPTRYYKYAEVVDEFTFDLFMEDTAPTEYEFATSLGLVFCVTEKAYKDSADGMASTPVGTAGYEVTDITFGTNVVVTKVDDYWAEDKKDSIASFYAANPGVIEFQLIAEATQQSIALDTGSVDCVPIMAATEISRFEDSEDYNIFTIKDYSPAYIMFNASEQSAFASKELRHAVAYAIDIESVIDGAKDGYADPCLTFGCDNMPDMPASRLEDGVAKYYPYNPEKAKELIAASGFDTSQTLKLMVENNTTFQDACEIIQGQLKEVGLKVQIDMYDGAAYTDYRTQNGIWDMRFGSNGAGTVISFYNDYLGNASLGTDENWAFVHDTKLQSLLEEATKIENYTNEELINECIDYVNETLYAYGIWIPYNFAVAVKGIDGVGLNLKNYPAPSGTVFNDSYVSPELG